MALPLVGVAPQAFTTLTALAAYVRDQLGYQLRVKLSDQLGPVAARQVATAIAGASAPFVTTSYSRARLIRQMYACGLLTGEHADEVGGAPS